MFFQMSSSMKSAFTSNFGIIKMLILALFLTTIPGVAADESDEAQTKPTVQVECGKLPDKALTDDMGRIIDGQNATNWPWQVLLVISKVVPPKKGESSSDYEDEDAIDNNGMSIVCTPSLCGGILISNDSVLSAAHCTPPSKRICSIEMYIGQYIYPPEKMKGRYLKIDGQQITTHPAFNEGTKLNDVSLIKLDYPLPLGQKGTPYENVRPICLANKKVLKKIDQENCLAVGFGRVNAFRFGPRVDPPVLQEGRMPIIDNVVCQQKLGASFDKTVQLCAGNKDGTPDTCKGDSGGALQCKSKGKAPHRWYLVGVTSRHFDIFFCADPEKPAGFARVAAFEEWINQTMNGIKQKPTKTPKPSVDNDDETEWIPEFPSPTTTKKTKRKNHQSDSQSNSQNGVQITINNDNNNE